MNYLTTLDAFDIAHGGKNEAFPRHVFICSDGVDRVWGHLQRHAAGRVIYGVKVFEFIVIGLALGWLLYFIP